MENKTRGIRLCAIGMFFIGVNLNIQFTTFMINVFPEWLGYGLLFLGLRMIDDKEDRFLEGAAAFLFIYSLLTFILGLMNQSIESIFISIICYIVQIYVVYGLLSVMMRIATQIDSEYYGALERMRTVAMTMMIITGVTLILGRYDQRIAFAAAMAGFSLIAIDLMIVGMLAKFRKEVEIYG